MTSGNKTIKSTADVSVFLAAVPDPDRRSDAEALCALLSDVTGLQPAMWGSAMVGFGDLHYRYASGREGDTFVVGFAPRKRAITLYLPDAPANHPALLSRLGKHQTGVGCLYLQRLADADQSVLRELVAETVATVEA